jgi:hypothetical protein
MNQLSLRADPRQVADPFGERAPLALSRRYGLLGANVAFRSDSPELLALVDEAYRGLPAHVVGGPALQVDLTLDDGVSDFGSAPPAARMFGGAGLLGAAMDAHNLALVSPETGRAVVCLSRALLRFPYHARYELIEFAVFTLACRAQCMVPLHAGCVGAGGLGALLIGESGAGKSTLALTAMQLGLAILTEDASFVDPGTLRATGIANFLHLRFDALNWVDDADLRARITSAPVIRRRSGVEKHELNLRGGWANMAPAPLRLAHLVFVTPEAAPDDALLRPLNAGQLLERLHISQPYAAGQPGWAPFIDGCSRIHGWELRRGSHPSRGALTLKGLLMT